MRIWRLSSNSGQKPNGKLPIPEKQYSIKMSGVHFLHISYIKKEIHLKRLGSGYKLNDKKVQKFR